MAIRQFTPLELAERLRRIQEGFPIQPGVLQPRAPVNIQELAGQVSPFVSARPAAAQAPSSIEAIQQFLAGIGGGPQIPLAGGIPPGVSFPLPQGVSPFGAPAASGPGIPPAAPGALPAPAPAPAPAPLPAPAPGGFQNILGVAAPTGAPAPGALPGALPSLGGPLSGILPGTSLAEIFQQVVGETVAGLPPAVFSESQRRLFTEIVETNSPIARELIKAVGGGVDFATRLRQQTTLNEDQITFLTSISPAEVLEGIGREDLLDLVQ